MPNRLLSCGITYFELWMTETELWVMEAQNPNSPFVSKTQFSMVFSQLNPQFLKFQLQCLTFWVFFFLTKSLSDKCQTDKIGKIEIF